MRKPVRSIDQNCRHQKQQNCDGDDAPEHEFGPVFPAVLMVFDQFGVVVASLHWFLPVVWARQLVVPDCLVLCAADFMPVRHGDRARQL